MKETKLLQNLTLLYVEDDPTVALSMKKTFEYFVDNVMTEASIDEAKIVMNRTHIDLLISDINLKNESGIDLIKDVREKNKKMPIIILSAYSDKEYLFEAVKLNLVDYLIKPVSLDTLVDALKKALEVIMGNNSIHIYFDNGIVYNYKEKILLDGEVEIKLTQSEEKLLELFIEHNNDYISKEIIQFHLWNQVDMSESAFKSLMNKLRKKIGKESLLNMSKVGYKLNLKNTTF